MNFDELNRQTRDWKNNQPVDFTRGMGLSPQERLAYLNNETYRANNGAHRDCPYSPYGSYSTGKRY